MKVTIEYEYDPQYANKFWAKTFMGEKALTGCSTQSFEDAKQILMKSISRFLEMPAVNVPPSEEVEIGVDEHGIDATVEAFHANQS